MEQDTICKECRYRLNVWAEDMRDEYTGCGILLKDAGINDNLQYYVNNILSEVIATGWVTNGHTAFNEQIITQGCYKCAFFEGK